MMKMPIIKVPVEGHAEYYAHGEPEMGTGEVRNSFLLCDEKTYKVKEIILETLGHNIADPAHFEIATLRAKSEDGVNFKGTYGWKQARVTGTGEFSGQLYKNDHPAYLLLGKAKGETYEYTWWFRMWDQGRRPVFIA